MRSPASRREGSWPDRALGGFDGQLEVRPRPQTARRRGKKRAAVATVHSLLVAIYHLLSRGPPYSELGGDYFDRTNTNRQTRYRLRWLKDLGVTVTITTPQEAA
jgi:hypothetical protein